MRIGWILVAMVACAGVYQVGVLAANWVDCSTLDPDRYPNVIFCDDFDSYCQGNSNTYPGGPRCASGTRKDEITEGRVWRRTSSNEYNGNLVGQELNIEENTYLNGSYNGTFIWPDYPNYGDNPDYPGIASGPFGAGIPTDGNILLGQVTFRDWVLSGLPMDSTPQVLNMSRLIGNVFNTPGHTYDLVAGTDANPLIVKYFLGGGSLGKIYFANGYVEVALDNERANSDYVRSQNCMAQCMPTPIAAGPFPIMCAQNNPQGPMPSGCPSISTAPVHGAIAVGVLSTLDVDPCHCASGDRHGSQNYHLALFDGQGWWNLDSQTSPPPGATFSGEVLPFKWSTAMPPAAGDGIGEPGRFTIDGGEGYQWDNGSGGSGGSPRSWHFIKLSIRSTTIDVELTTQEKGTTSGEQYYVKSVVTGIPRKYVFTGSGPIGSGAFNTVRFGIGSGCALDNNTSWSTCAVNDAGHRSRTPIQVDPQTSPARQGSMYFNDFILYGGTGFENEGACCAASGTPTCTEVLQGNCVGLFKGPSTKCARVTCCPKTFGDNDRNGIVDMNDFAALQQCLTVGNNGAVTPGCVCFDYNGGGLDGTDVEHFVDCANGPGVPGNTGIVNTGHDTVSCAGIDW